MQEKQNSKKYFQALSVFILALGFFFMALTINNRSVLAAVVDKQTIPLEKKLGMNIFGDSFKANPRTNTDSDPNSVFESRWNTDIDAMKQLNMKYVRLGASYSTLLSKDNEGDNNNPSNYNDYDFSRLDYAIHSAKSAGLTPIISMYADSNIASKNNDTNYNNSAYPDDLARTKDLINQLVDHEADKGVLWEGFNEAESGSQDYWFGQTDMEADDKQKLKDVVMMDKYFQDQVNKYDQAYDSNPDSNFITGDLGGSSGLANEIINLDPGVFDNTKNNKTSGFGSFHAYKGYTPEDVLKGNTNDQVLTQTDPTADWSSWDAKEIESLRAQGLKPAITEFGYPYPDGWSLGGSESRQQQSDNLEREIFSLDMEGADMIIPFTMEHTNAQWALKNSSDQNQTSPASAFSNLQKLMNQLHGYTFSQKVSSEDNSLGNHSDDNGNYVLKYTKDNSPDKYVYWTTTADNKDLDHTLEINGTPVTATASPQISEPHS